MDYLNRANAPLDAAVWERIDATAVQAARDVLTARRFLPVDGPYGLGLTSIEVGADDYCREPGAGEAGAVLSRAVSVPMLRREFSLSIRRIEAQREMSQPLDLRAVADAAEAVARREEEFVYQGQPDFGLHGLLNVPGHHEVGVGSWAHVNQALEDVLNAVNTLDGAGFHGPYALAINSAWYNDLFRRYEGSDVLQLDHLSRLCAGGVFKAPIAGGVLVDPHVGRIVIGQDLRAGYAAQDGIHYRLYLSESVVPMLEEPGAICVLKAA